MIHTSIYDCHNQIICFIIISIANFILFHRKHNTNTLHTNNINFMHAYIDDIYIYIHAKPSILS